MHFKLFVGTLVIAISMLPKCSLSKGFSLEQIQLHNKQSLGNIVQVVDDEWGFWWIFSDNGVHIFDGEHCSSFSSLYMNEAYTKATTHFTNITVKAIDKRFVIYSDYGRGRSYLFDMRNRRIVDSNTNGNYRYTWRSKNGEYVFVHQDKPNLSLLIDINTTFSGKPIRSMRIPWNGVDFSGFFEFEKFVVMQLGVKFYKLDLDKLTYAQVIDGYFSATAFQKSDSMFFLNWNDAKVYRFGRDFKPKIYSENYMNNGVIDYFLFVDNRWELFVKLKQIKICDRQTNKVDEVDLTGAANYIKNADKFDMLQMFSPKNGDLILVLANGLYRIRKEKINRQLVESFLLQNSKHSYRAITQDAQKRIYVTYYKGVQRLKGNQLNDFLAYVDTSRDANSGTYSLHCFKNYMLWNNVLIDRTKHTHQFLGINKYAGHVESTVLDDKIIFAIWDRNQIYTYNLVSKSLDSVTYPAVMDNALSRNNSVNKIVYSSSDNCVYLPSVHAGILKVGLNGILYKQYLNPSDRKDCAINDIYLRHDTLFGASEKGVLLVNLRTDQYKFYPISYIDGEQLKTKAVFSLLPDDKGGFYLGTDNGLAYFDVHNQTIGRLPEGHSLSAVEFNRNSRFRSVDKTNYMGSIDGLYAFKDEDIEFTFAEKTAPFISLLYFAHQRANENSEYLYVNRLQRNNIAFPHSSINYKFAFLSPSFSNKVYYSYQLQGLSADWSPYSTTSLVEFNSLPAGSYTLNLKACYASNSSETTTLCVPFTVSEVWFKKPLYIVLLATLIMSFALYIINIRRKMQLKMQQKYSDLRTKISADLHDDLGGVLSNLNLQAYRLSQELDQAHAEKTLKISSLSKEAIDKMRETVWFIDNRKDTMRNLIEKINNYGTDLLKPIAASFIMEDFIESDFSINPEFRKNIFLIAKEACTNALKHANTTYVKIHFSLQAGQLLMKIENNGVKIIGGSIKHGSGIRNMEWRAKQLDGKCVYYLMDAKFSIQVTAPIK